MSWLRTGDNASMYPLLMEVAGYDPEDDRLINEVFGWLTRCALYSASQTTDGIVQLHVARMMGMTRTQPLIDISVDVGLMTLVEVKGKKALRIIDDAEFLHILTKAEVENNRQRKRDNSNAVKKAQILLRDGIACRWCGIATNWNNDRKSARAGELDHQTLTPGQDTPIEKIVVSCRSCNRARGGNPDTFPHKLRPAPSEPLYSIDTAAFIQKYLDLIVPVDDLRAGATPVHAAAPVPDQRPGSNEPAPAVDDPELRPDGPSEPALPASHSVQAAQGASGSADATVPGSVDPRYPGSGFPGSGRDGSGRAGTGQDGSGQVGSGRDAAGRRRSRRSRRRGGSR